MSLDALIQTYRPALEKYLHAAVQRAAGSDLLYGTFLGGTTA